MIIFPWIVLAVWQVALYAFGAFVTWDLLWIGDLGEFGANDRVGFIIVWLVGNLPAFAYIDR